MVSAAQLKQLFPTAKLAILKAIVENWPVAEAAGINTPLRIAHFFAQIGHESGGLRSVEESLNYTSAARIRATWDTRFKSNADAAPYVRQPKALAIKVYGGRMGNKPAPATDGWDYRGGGLMQTTGREGYRALGFESNPEALREPKTAFLTAVAEWSNRLCNTLADVDDVVAIRKAINGGTNGLNAVRTLLFKCQVVFGVKASSAADPVSKPVVPAANVRQLDTSDIQLLQMRLTYLGYPEVGAADGRYGTKTRAAILAFQADNDLPLDPTPTAELLARLGRGRKREVSAERASATKETIADKPAVAVTDLVQKVGTGIIASSGVGAVLDGSGDLQKVLESANKIKAISEAVLSISPWLLIGAAGVAAVILGRKLLSHLISEYREGRLL
jgi:predicted chitinase